MGIFNSGNKTVNVKGQAIGGSVESADSPAALRRLREVQERLAAAQQQGDPAPADVTDDDLVNEYIQNTGTGSINITNVTINGRHIGHAER